MQNHNYPATAVSIQDFEAFSLNNKAQVFSRNGDHASAENLHKRALAIKQQSFGASSIQAALTHDALGKVQLKLGKLDEAEVNLRIAVILRNLYQFDGLDAAVSRDNLGQLLEAQGKMADAKAIRLTGAPGAVICSHNTCLGQTLSIDKLSACSKCKATPQMFDHDHLLISQPQSVFYCSKDCQVADWKLRHKRLCKKAEAATA